MQRQHRFTRGLLQITALAFGLLFDYQEFTEQCVLHAALTFIDPLFILRRVEVVGPTGL
jgi:hypothetical protein